MMRDPRRYVVLGDTTLGIKEDSDRLIIPIKAGLSNLDLTFTLKGSGSDSRKKGSGSATLLDSVHRSEQQYYLYSF